MKPLKSSLERSPYLPVAFKSKRRCWLVCAVTLLIAGNVVQAQSTGTEVNEQEQELSEVTVTAVRSMQTIGNMTEQTAAKSRVTVTNDTLLTAASGQTLVDALSQVPGLSFTNSDAYGSSGGNIRLRGLDGSRVSLTFDGVQINDSGNYAVFTNQLPDTEIVDRVDVNLGSTDVDSPTASATGGTIAFKTRRPASEFGGLVSLAAGQNDFRRAFLMLDSGEIGPWGTSAFVTVSDQKYDKFKGPGELEKRQFNFRVYQGLTDGDFVSLAGHFNRNRNAFYRNSTAANFATFGTNFDNLAVCTRAPIRAGVADNDNLGTLAGGTENPLNPSACTNYFNLRVNPSDTGNLRVQSLFGFGSSLRLSFDAAYQYVLANGGGTQFLTETPAANNADRRVVGQTGLGGWDLNGDRDLLDTVRFYAPNTTNTNRISGTASLIWDISNRHRTRIALTSERARHRQTAQWGILDAEGNPEDVFAGLKDDPVLTADGSELRGRDRFSIAELNQVALEYRGRFLDERLVATLGMRAPRFQRELNQFCFTQNGGSGNSGGVLCTTQTPVATRANGNVVFVNSANAVQYIAPYRAKVKFDDVLPNLGLTFKPAQNHMLYASFARGISAPRTDNLYSVARVGNDPTIRRSSPESEETSTYDLGWRYSGETVLTSAALWKTDYKNRIVSAFDPDLGFSVDRNVGVVTLQGLDVQAGWRASDKLAVTGFVSYIDSELKDNVQVSSTVVIPTAGKRFVETPEWSLGARLDLEVSEAFRLGLEAKHIGDRFATDLNDAEAEKFTLWDFYARYRFDLAMLEGLELQFNVKNLLDEDYFGSIGSQQNALPFTNVLNGTQVTGVSSPTFSVGAPRTSMLSLRMRF